MIAVFHCICIKLPLGRRDNCRTESILGILIAMRLHHVPTADLFWSPDPIFCMDPIARIMVVKRFKKAHFYADPLRVCIKVNPPGSS